jgi:drug/metabolite transporter (DMT)-like permease
VLLGERLGFGALAGLALVAAGIYLVNKPQSGDTTKS